jgi:D-alanyl-D-alanine carboxypeptidase/D-alanyl-D-alanine-endopeptidase (penicillin-binding protein 4)
VSDLKTWVAEGRGRLGLAVVSLSDERLVAAHDESVALNPASNQKVLTAAAALARLGPHFRYTTSVNGTLKDGSATQLVVRGHGDPSLRTADIWAMAAELVGMGLRKVQAGILVDQSKFDGDHVPPAFDQQPNEWASFRAPVSAVALDSNTITLNVAADRAGAPARVWFEPPGLAVVAGSVATEPAGSGNSIRYSVQPAAGRVRATIGGSIAEGLPPARFSRRVDDPRLSAGYALKFALERLGVEVAGEVSTGGAAEKTELVVHRSEPLSKLIEQLGKDSDNFYAEMLLKTLGGEVRGAPATSAGGAQALVEWLRRIGAWTPGTVVTNGSGLFDANRVSALTLARALTAAYRDPAIGPETVAHLAVGGVDGTLRSRFRSHRATRVVRAKTGTLDRVVALSGYVLGQSPFAFSIIVTDMPGKHAETRRKIDDVVEALIALGPAGTAAATR